VKNDQRKTKQINTLIDTIFSDANSSDKAIFYLRLPNSCYHNRFNAGYRLLNIHNLHNAIREDSFNTISIILYIFTNKFIISIECTFVCYNLSKEKMNFNLSKKKKTKKVKSQLDYYLPKGNLVSKYPLRTSSISLWAIKWLHQQQKWSPKSNQK
jgi:hypothetical protein